MKYCNASMLKYMICSWKSLTLCLSLVRLPGSTSPCTVEFHLNWNRLNRLTILIADKRFLLMAFSATWCGPTLWMTKKLFMVISRITLSATVQITLERNLSNSCSVRTACLASSVVIKSNKRASRCTDGALRTPSHMWSPSFRRQTTAVAIRTRLLFSSLRTITCNLNSMLTPSRLIRFLKDLIYSVGHCLSLPKKWQICSTISSSHAHQQSLQLWKTLRYPKKWRSSLRTHQKKNWRPISKRWNVGSFSRIKSNQLVVWISCSKTCVRTKKSCWSLSRCLPMASYRRELYSRQDPLLDTPPDSTMLLKGSTHRTRDVPAVKVASDRSTDRFNTQSISYFLYIEPKIKF